MASQFLVLALAASPLVAAHGKVAVLSSALGGNTTALGIKGGVVPGAGPNSKTEVDTTVFNNVNPMTDGLGHTTGGGQNTLALLSEAMAQSGPVLPQIASTGGMLSGTYCIVTEDGAGPIKAVIDPTGTGAFSKGTMLDVVTQVPGQNGNIAAPKKQKQQRSPWTRITRRAANVNENFPIQVAVPAGIKCTGTVAGQKNVCLVKLANMNKNGPFGGVVAVQMADAQAADAQAAAGKGTTAKGTAGQETA